MDFEFDPAKSSANAVKHGIDFEAAQAIWQDDRHVELETGARGNEERNLVVGEIDGKCWTAVVTLREWRIRIISVRRSRDDEREDYYRRGIRPDVR